MNRRDLAGLRRVHRLGALLLGWGMALAGWAADSSPLPDEDLKVTHRVTPDFPIRALVEGAGQGDVRALLAVDEAGQLKDLLVVAYSRKEFADATDVAIREWRFSPARRAGRAVPAVMELECRFGIQGVVYVDRKGPGSAAEPLVGVQFVHRPCSPRDLDQPVKAVARPAPVYPHSWGERGMKGRVEVEFFVDTSGRIRFPTVVSADHPALAAQALAAVEQWRFEPPRRHGQPALLRASQVFEFTPAG